MFFKIVIIILVSLHFVPIPGSSRRLHAHHSIHTDKAALLAFKSGLKSDPYSRLENWTEETDVCNFTSVKCDDLHHRVVEINLNDSSLLGLLPRVFVTCTLSTTVSLEPFSSKFLL
ncbi:hypothetical protein BUALT_Bualt02G0102400 [Buddleja alternifolia]|uniref:Leucine-rich repeat-containing N-terminal plant-type domain-containing protein n=1 Tax=Buddleja alternifolia TaxID=168488 RepID=A0AAV6XZK5_9LAMI|nr:hypothetical protein BUALT_Bualt02G0102400 [Buddleja alternifolia]